MFKPKTGRLFCLADALYAPYLFWHNWLHPPLFRVHSFKSMHVRSSVYSWERIKFSRCFLRIKFNLEPVATCTFETAEIVATVVMAWTWCALVNIVASIVIMIIFCAGLATAVKWSNRVRATGFSRAHTSFTFIYIKTFTIFILTRDQLDKIYIDVTENIFFLDKSQSNNSCCFDFCTRTRTQLSYVIK